MKSLANWTRFSVMLTLALAIALLPALPAFAQGGGEEADLLGLMCQDLPADDCDQLSSAFDNMDGVTSFVMPGWRIELALTADGETMRFEAQGDGALSVDEAGETAAIYLNIVDAIASAEGESESGSAEFLLLDDMIYIRWDGQWYGGPAEGQMDGLGMGEDMDDLGLDGMELGEMELDELFGMFDGPLGDGALLDNAVNARRLPGDGPATYEVTLNVPMVLGQLLTSPGMGGLLGDVLGDEGVETDSLTPEDGAFLALLLAPVLGQSSFELSFSLSEDGDYLGGLGFDAVLDVDPAIIDPEASPVLAEASFMVEMADFNAELSLEAPEDYLPLEALEDMDM